MSYYNFSTLFRMKKVLFCGTYPGQSTGYAKITNIITNFLADHCDLYHLAFQSEDHVTFENNDKITRFKDDAFGYDVIKDIIIDNKIETVIVYNDVLVCANMINIFQEYKNILKCSKIYLYLDLTYKYENHIRDLSKYCDKIVCFNKSWETHLRSLNINNVITIEHPKFYPNIHEYSVNKSEIGLDENDFVILNLNRNSFRKCLDVTMDAFVQFFKMNGCQKNLKLFMGCKYNYAGSYDIVKIALVYAKIHGLAEEQTDTLINSCIMRPPQDNMTTEQVNRLYNCCDVGINTCGGEGYGLCNVEHQLTGKPQILTALDNFKEIFDEKYCCLVPVKTRMTLPLELDACGGILEIPDPAEAANAMQYYYKNPHIRKIHGEMGKKHLESKEDQITRWLQLLQTE